jgi:hypothetical protein
MEFLSLSQPIDFSDSKQASPLDWFKGLLSRIPDQVVFSEVAQGAPVDVGNSAIAANGIFNASEVDLDRRISARMRQDSVDYKEARRRLRAEGQI